MGQAVPAGSEPCVLWGCHCFGEHQRDLEMDIVWLLSSRR